MHPGHVTGLCAVRTVSLWGCLIVMAIVLRGGSGHKKAGRDCNDNKQRSGFCPHESSFGVQGK